MNARTVSVLIRFKIVQCCKVPERASQMKEHSRLRLDYGFCVCNVKYTCIWFHVESIFKARKQMHYFSALNIPEARGDTRIFRIFRIFHMKRQDLNVIQCDAIQSYHGIY